MLDWSTATIAVVTLVVLFLWYRGSVSPRLPPSPKGSLPLLGHFFCLPSDPRAQVQIWRKECGDIFSLFVLGTPLIVLNGYDLVKEALVKKADFFSDRPHTFTNEVTNMKEKGIIFSNGANWKEQRTVSLSILREFGMGKNILALKIQEEVDSYIDHLNSMKDKPIDLRIMTNISTSNIICSILFGKRFEYNDVKFQDLMLKLNSQISDQNAISLINFCFWLRFVPGDLFKAKRLVANRLLIIKTLLGFVDDIRRESKDKNEVNNFVDAYTLETSKRKQEGLATFLDDPNLAKMMFDLFAAGTETTSTTIYWCILFLLNHPQVQDKVYAEIEEKVGTSRRPTIQDKPQLSYLTAVILETQRLGSIVPLSVTHKCSEDVTLAGYTIPKGAYISPNLDSVLHDETIWGRDALKFRPERFIDPQGKVQIAEQFIPFSAGRRICLGEALAKMELFLFLSTMIQKFEFLPVDPNNVPPLKYKPGIVYSPLPYQVNIRERNERV